MFNINLIPWRAEHRRLKLRYLVTLIIVATAFLVIGAWSGEVFLRYHISQSSYEIKRLEKEVQELKQQEDAEKEKIQKIEQIKSANVLMKIIKLNNKNVYHQMASLVSQVPKTMKLLELNYESHKWELQGIAKDKADLLNWSKKMQAQDAFNQCQFKKWEVNDEGISFLFKEDA